MSAKTLPPSDVAIITVSYNSSSQLNDFLSSALKTVSSPKHITVVDNKSADIEITEQLTNSLGVNLLKLETNLGYGSAINRAVPQLSQDLRTLLICNPDSELNVEAVVELRNAVQAERVGVAGPKILNLDGTVYPSARSIPSLRNGIGHAFFANIWQNNPWTKNYLSDAHHKTSTVPTGWVSGACLAIRRDVFSSIGGFDERYFMYFEDVDLGFRLTQLGFTNLFIAESSITHIGGLSTQSVKSQMNSIHHQSAKTFVSVRYPGKRWWLVRAVLNLGISLRSRAQSWGSK